MSDYDFTMTLHPWGEDLNKGVGEIKIDLSALYGYWEYIDGSEGGGLWFERRNNRVVLTDYDGAFDLPKKVWEMLAKAGVDLSEMQVEPDPPEDRPKDSFVSAREAAIDEQAAMYDDNYEE